MDTVDNSGYNSKNSNTHCKILWIGRLEFFVSYKISGVYKGGGTKTLCNMLKV